MQTAGSLISLPLFPSKISLSPSLLRDVPVGFWNTEIACVLFYLSGIQWEFPLQPTAGSGMSSQVSTHFITSLSPTRSLLFPSSPALALRCPPLPTFPPIFISFLRRVPLSVRSPFQGWSLARGWHGEKSRPVPKLTNCSLQTQRVAVEMGSHMAKLDLLTLSTRSLLLFLFLPLPLAPLNVTFPSCAILWTSFIFLILDVNLPTVYFKKMALTSTCHILTQIH